MRVCFLTSTPMNVYEGSGTYTAIAGLAEGLRLYGVEVRILTPRRRWPVHTAERFAFNRSVERELAVLRPDVTVGFDMDGYRLDLIRTPYAVSIKGVIADEVRFETGLTRLSMRWQAACERANILRARLVIAPSAYSARMIDRYYGYRFEKVCVVPEPIHLEKWRRNFEQHSGEPPSRFTVLAVGRFYRRKQLHTLLEAAAQVPDIELRIAGDGPERRRLFRRARQLKLDDRVRWLGMLPRGQLVPEFLRCHVFCLPSIQEAFGIVFLEAMAAGKPVVAARAAAVPEVVADGSSGILVPPRDPVALADALVRLRDDASLRQRLGECGRKRVEAFDLPKISLMFLNLLKRLT